MNSKTRLMVRKAVVGAIFAVINMVAAMLNAAVVNITEGSTTGYTMTDGNTYVIQNSVTFSNSTIGGNGMSVEAGATVVLYVPQNVTLTAVGANGSGQTGGGAGIRIPATSTLVITGEGRMDYQTPKGKTPSGVLEKAMDKDFAYKNIVRTVSQIVRLMTIN